WLGWVVKDCSELMAELRDAQLPQSTIGRKWLLQYANWARNLQRVRSQVYLVDERDSAGSLSSLFQDIKEILNDVALRSVGVTRSNAPRRYRGIHFRRLRSGIGYSAMRAIEPGALSNLTWVCRGVALSLLLLFAYAFGATPISSLPSVVQY